MKYRFQLMMGQYVRDEPVGPDGAMVPVRYVWNNPEWNIIKSDTDLEERFGEKFKRLPEETELLSGISEDAFIREAIRRGLIKPPAINPELDEPDELEVPVGGALAATH
jgi:hypothetical protein